jgi:hypothetical protein
VFTYLFSISGLENQPVNAPTKVPAPGHIKVPINAPFSALEPLDLITASYEFFSLLYSS